MSWKRHIPSHNASTFSQSVLSKLDRSDVQSQILPAPSIRTSTSLKPKIGSSSRLDKNISRKNLLPSLSRNKLRLEKEEDRDQLMKDMVEETVKASRTSLSTLPSNDKFLRHPLKDGLKLFLIGDELNRENRQYEDIMLFSQARDDEQQDSNVANDYYVPKLMKPDRSLTDQGSPTNGRLSKKSTKVVHILKKDLARVSDIESYL